MRHKAIAMAGIIAFSSLAASAGETMSPLSPIVRATDWIGTPPTAGDLRGKVVVVDVFTVDCYNCHNVVPALRQLYAADRKRGLVVIGIHTPETPSEKQRPYVVGALQAQSIVWPVAVDNGFDLWNAYGVRAWPTQFFFDRTGRLRQTVVGDSQDALVRQTVTRLLSEPQP